MYREVCVNEITSYLFGNYYWNNIWAVLKNKYSPYYNNTIIISLFYSKE